ncbi:hypothetical protein BH23GEM2_BH23GEM2_14690 [soil metagenome]
MAPRGRRIWVRTLAACSLLLLGPVAAAAQSNGAFGVELRIDGLAGGRESPAALHAGAGVIRRLGTYARVALVGGAGPSEDGISWRLESAARFHLDPFRQRRWGVYGGAGAGIHWADSAEPFLLILLGAEGGSRGGWAPAIELGLSRGARLGVVLRRAAPDRR